MPVTTIISSTQQRSKDSYGSSPVVGLALRTNGETKPTIIDSLGGVYLAGITAPTVAPIAAPALAGSGWTIGNCVAYVYVYASSKFPFVETDGAINGRLWPRSNQSPATASQITAGNLGFAGSCTMTTEAGVTNIWLFRTAIFATTAEALVAANAGQAFFVVELVNSGAGTVAWTDNNPVSSADQVQTDNFVAPQMQFNVFYDPYWWGFGNLPFTATATWSNSGAGLTGLVTISGTDKWFDGRNGQNISFAGIVTGGYDGNGTYLFKWISATTAGVTLDGTTLVPINPLTTVSGLATLQGPATTLYRSKPRNPFSWGYTEVIGGANVPQQYAFKVGGGLGTALAVVPNNPILKLDCEYPAKCFTLNLRTAGTAAFEPTLRIISDAFSVTAHFSQFVAVTSNGNLVLWGIDFKNFAILQCDGNTQVPISLMIPQTMRSLTTDRTRQLLSHGVYDPRTELNCMWVSTSLGISLVNYLIYQHAPTGYWGFSNEQDTLCSASIQDTLTGANKTFVGTQTGILGQAFVQNAYSNYLPPTGTYTGTVLSGTVTTITTANSTPVFNTTDDGIIGNWCLVTDSTGQQEQWARISVRAARTLTFDAVRSYIGGSNINFNPVPTAGFLFYIGLIECQMTKYFDFATPQTDKQLMELWLTQAGLDPSTAGTLIRFYREHEAGYTQFGLLRDVYNGGANSDVWFSNNTVPSELVKMFGLTIINRGYSQWRLLNTVLKPRLNQ